MTAARAARDVAGGEDAGVDPGEEQPGELAGVPGVVDGRVVGVDQGGDDVAQPAPVAAAAGAVAAFGAGLLEQVGDGRRRPVGCRAGCPAAVRGVAGLVDEQPVGGGDVLLVGGAARVGDVGAADVGGVDLDAADGRGRSRRVRRRRRRGRRRRSGRCGRSASAPGGSRPGPRRPSRRRCRTWWCRLACRWLLGCGMRCSVLSLDAGQRCLPRVRAVTAVPKCRRQGGDDLGAVVVGGAAGEVGHRGGLGRGSCGRGRSRAARAAAAPRRPCRRPGRALSATAAVTAAAGTPRCLARSQSVVTSMCTSNREARASVRMAPCTPGLWPAMT